MTTTSTQFETAARPLLAVLETVPPGSWGHPSPCAGWSARDVLDHLIGTQREFLTGRGVDLGAAPDVADDPAAAWRDHAKRVAESISDDDVVQAGYHSLLGPTTVGATFERFYVWDMVVHRWDIARAVGQDAGLTDAELDRMESGGEGFGEALHMDGVCKPAVDVPADADRAVRVLARLGRAG